MFQITILQDGNNPVPQTMQNEKLEEMLLLYDYGALRYN